jgi:hypothetical protein
MPSFRLVELSGCLNLCMSVKGQHRIAGTAVSCRYICVPHGMPYWLATLLQCRSSVVPMLAVYLWTRGRIKRKFPRSLYYLQRTSKEGGRRCRNAQACLLKYNTTLWSWGGQKMGMTVAFWPQHNFNIERVLAGFTRHYNVRLNPYLP